ncbi:MAG: hypothetical protein JW860_01785 [Sedimentisphaerales bacterium]|nr:hypothetical protein [Sedimentisphaerales bacterium]
MIEKFKENQRGFWHENRWYILIFTIALLCDAASTIYFMMQDGNADSELHPGIRIISKITGPFIGPLLGGACKALGGLVVGIYCRRFARYIFIAASLISFWAAWYNIWGVNLYVPMIFRWLVWFF